MGGSRTRRANIVSSSRSIGSTTPLKIARRKLAIDQNSFGSDHPGVARDLFNLSGFLRSTNRFAEAEPLMRRGLLIDETSYGPDHPDVAADLNRLVSLLHDMNRFAEAEPLMRRALAIDEKNFGPDHPDVARDLNALADLLFHANRLAEAEPLMHRVLAILDAFGRRAGHQHPQFEAMQENYAGLLRAMGKSHAEVAAAIDALSHPPP